MLRKRSRSHQKDQHHMGHLTISDANTDYYSQSHALGHSIKGHSIFKAPCLFVGLGPKSLLDSDSVRSPTSPLDARVLSNLGNPVRNPRSSSHEGNQRSWDCCKVGLGIIESLEDCSRFSGKIFPSPKSKQISLSPQMIIKTPDYQTYMDSLEKSKSLPNDFCKVQNRSVVHQGESTVFFEIGETGLEHELFGKTRSCSLDSCSPLKVLSGFIASNTDSDIDNFALKDITIPVSSPPHFTGGSQNSNTIFTSNDLLKSLSASEIELSEDYTCVISHGPNPKTTHIFGDCILETHPSALNNYFKNEENEKGVILNKYPSSDFLSFCHRCNKKLKKNEDIYIYGGEKAFCSLDCREMEIMIDEKKEKSNPPSKNSPKPKFGEKIFETGIPTAT